MEYGNFIALFVGILLTVFRYFEFVSKTVYEEVFLT